MWTTVAFRQTQASHVSTNRFGALDALRGIAAILVVIQHASDYLLQNSSMAAEGPILAELVKVFDPGRIGVICFFLISGFIIPSSFPKRSSMPLSEFATKRFFRLYPAYWLSLILALLTDAWLLQEFHSPVEVFANVTMVQKLLGQEHVQGLYWTLQVELIFYFLCATLFAVNSLESPRRVLGAIVLVLIAFAVANLAGSKMHVIDKFNKELFYTPYLLGVMLCGTLLRIWVQNNSKTNRAAAMAGVLLVFMVPVLNMILSTVGINLIADPLRFLMSHMIGLAFFLISMLYWKSPPNVLLKAGLYSYSIYLFHPIVMHILGGFVAEESSFKLLPQILWIQVLTTILLTCVLSALTYRFIEAPSNEKAKKLCRRVFH